LTKKKCVDKIKVKLLKHI